MKAGTDVHGVTAARALRGFGLRELESAESSRQKQRELRTVDGVQAESNPRRQRQRSTSAVRGSGVQVTFHESIKLKKFYYKVQHHSCCVKEAMRNAHAPVDSHRDRRCAAPAVWGERAS